MLIYLSSLDTQEDKDEFIELYNTYRKRLWHIAARILKDEYAAEDIVHEAFLKVSKNFEYYRSKSQNENGCLIVTMVTWLSCNQIKREKSLKFSPLEEEILSDDYDSEPEGIVISNDQYQRLVACLSRLDEGYESVLNLKWALGYSNQDIAKLLEISEENVRLRVHRGRKLLIEQLRKEGVGYGQ